MPDIQKAVNWMLNIAMDDTHGYDQANRQGPDYDCSALVSSALYQAGFNVKPWSWTGNMYAQLIAADFREIDNDNDRRAGDIWLTPYAHTCMSLNSEQIIEASGNEFGTAFGGKSGDQTGREIAVKGWYRPSYGWRYHLRYMEPVTGKSPYQIAAEVICGKWGNGAERKRALTVAGYDYAEVQTAVNYYVAVAKWMEVK